MDRALWPESIKKNSKYVKIYKKKIIHNYIIILSTEFFIKPACILLHVRIL
jgi:hypothetical protein